MAGLNKWQGIGYLGRDPELRHTQGGGTVATLNVACSRKYKDRDGNLCEETEWVRVVAWGRLGETAAEHLRKGALVYVEGRMKTTPWEKDGVKHYSTDIVASVVQFLDRRQGDGRPLPSDDRGAPRGEPPRGEDSYIPTGPGDDDIPF